MRISQYLEIGEIICNWCTLFQWDIGFWDNLLLFHSLCHKTFLFYVSFESLYANSPAITIISLWRLLCWLIFLTFWSILPSQVPYLPQLTRIWWSMWEPPALPDSLHISLQSTIRPIGANFFHRYLCSSTMPTFRQSGKKNSLACLQFDWLVQVFTKSSKIDSSLVQVN